MPNGAAAKDPNTVYYVYEFMYRGKVFYVGICHGDVRQNKRDVHVKNLMKHDAAGTLTKRKHQDYYCKSNQVVARLIKLGIDYHVQAAWTGKGKAAAEVEEKKQIAKRASEGLKLSNQSDNPRKATLDEIYESLGIS